ncbi:MAG TPA: hypothetical protein VFR78_13025 [Pyrinomonadaceae bacterium]|nr:hypothetical protein [Pyrinomonadaceae bacterium]
MKSILNRVVVMLVVGALTGVLALGKTIEKKVTFIQSLEVNGTLVKKGTYKVSFNDETGELTIRKGDKVIATAQARLEKTNDRYNFYSHAPAADPSKAPVLVSVSFKDGDLAKIVSSDPKVSSRQ